MGLMMLYVCIAVAKLSAHEFVPCIPTADIRTGQYHVLIQFVHADKLVVVIREIFVVSFLLDTSEKTSDMSLGILEG